MEGWTVFDRREVISIQAASTADDLARAPLHAVSKTLPDTARAERLQVRAPAGAPVVHRDLSRHHPYRYQLPIEACRITLGERRRSMKEWHAQQRRR